jgi:D-sedoheptulose 7-phosphate isomerase
MTDTTGAARAARELRQLASVAEASAVELAGLVSEVARVVATRIEGGNKLLFCGNGGSAADAQHLAAEYVVRFRRSRRALRALSLAVDSSVLTAAANDSGFETIFARQVEALADEGDVLFLNSTSGESENMIRAAEAARSLGVTTVGLLARGGGRLGALVDMALVVPTDDTARAQEMHSALGHVICELVESRLAEKEIST